MPKIFLSHSSKDKKLYVEIVKKNLIKEYGEENVIIDEISFQEGRKTIEEINEYLEITDLFALFISESSLESEWVQNEIEEVEHLLSKEKIEQICPIIIDEKVKYDDPRIPNLLKNNYNLQYISRPSKTAHILIQRLIEISYQKHPRLKEKNEIFVGRNDLIQQFEERIDDYEKKTPRCIIATGIKSIGRTTLAKKCIYKTNIKKSSYQFPMITIDDKESIEDFIFKLYDLGLTSDIDLEKLMEKKVEEKEKIVVQLLLDIQNQQEIIFVEDNGCIINHDGEMSQWFFNAILSNDLSNKVTICLISRFRCTSFSKKSSYDDRENFMKFEVDELSKVERNGLLNRYLEFENIPLDIEDFKIISNLLVGYPEQVFFTVTLIREKGLDYVKNHTEEIVEFNSKKASILLNEVEKNNDKIQFLALLSSFDYIGMKFIFDIVGDDIKYKEYIREFFSKSICEYVGVMKEYIRVNETIKDYVVRNNYMINEQHKFNLKEKTKVLLNDINIKDYDVPEFLYSLKESIKNNEGIDDKYIIPSLYLKTMNDLYIKNKNREVVSFAYKALERESFMDERIVFELRYLLCSALAKLQDKRFSEEVYKIEGAAHDFLFAFYYRQIGKLDRALEKINRSMEKRKNFSKAKREKVQIYLGMQDFQEARELAKENYENYKDNPYHIQAYFSCLIKADKTKEDKIILRELLDALKNISNDVSKEMFLRCTAQYKAFCEDNEDEAIYFINKAIEMNPNINYARIVKFDICDKFNLINEMDEIIDFFKKDELKRKFHNNLVCFECIRMAKDGKIEESVSNFNINIRNYTDEAKEKFITRLKNMNKIAVF